MFTKILRETILRLSLVCESKNNNYKQNAYNKIEIDPQMRY